MLPSANIYDVGARVVSFRSSIAHPAFPLSTLRCVPRDTQCKTRGRGDRYSFLVRIFHSLLQAGLARRTNIPISLIFPATGHLSVNACSIRGDVKNTFLPH